MKKNILLTAVIIGVSCLLVGSAAAQTPKKQRTALMVWGGWEGHEPKQCVDIFAPWLESQGFKVEISHSLDAYLDLEKLRKLDLIVHIFTMSDIKPEQERNLEEAVKIMEKGLLLRETFADHIFEMFIANKRAEIEEYNINVSGEFEKQVSEFEVKKYLPIL